MQLWEEVLAGVGKRVVGQNFEVWFSPTSLQRHDAKRRKLIVRVPNKHFKNWLSQHYDDEIREALDEAGLESYQVEFVTDDASDDSPPPDSEGPGGKDDTRTALRTDGANGHSRLNPKYTFNGFVVGNCNQFAHAASLAVADQPATAYNPLFIYGGTGLGKTHLMHAIGHAIRAERPSARLSYMSSEQFMNELIGAIRFDRTPQFREKYRNIDVLLMDDVQFLAGKERTQEEFFHTFNALYDSQKQIVVSSDSPPKEIPSLEERLHSRFEWGLIADMAPPDLETKVAILKKKAALQGTVLSEDVAMHIAANTKSNVRELEGSLVRLLAFGSLTGEEVSLSLAQRVLKPLADSAPKVVTIDLIQRAVADMYSLKPADLKARSNSRRIVLPRQVAMYVSKQLTPCSLPQIGQEFGKKHHTTVLHAVRKIDELRGKDPALEAILTRLFDMFK